MEDGTLEDDQNRRDFTINAMVDASFFIISMEGYLISSPTFYPSHLNTGYPAASFMPVLNYNNNRRVCLLYTSIGEVVVVGYGQQKKASVVGSITQTTGEVLERAAEIGRAHV